MHTQESVREFCAKINFRGSQVNSELKTLHTILNNEEKLIRILEGTLSKIHSRSFNGQGIVIATDKRVIFFRKSILGTTTLEEIPLPKISSISHRKGLMLSSIYIQTSNNEAVVSNCEKNQAEQFATTIRNLINNISEPKAPANNTLDNLEVLEKLFDMKEKGILTEEEYQDQKRKLLA